MKWLKIFWEWIRLEQEWYEVQKDLKAKGVQRFGFSHGPAAISWEPATIRPWWNFFRKTDVLQSKWLIPRRERLKGYIAVMKAIENSKPAEPLGDSNGLLPIRK